MGKLFHFGNKKTTTPTSFIAFGCIQDTGPSGRSETHRMQSLTSRRSQPQAPKELESSLHLVSGQREALRSVMRRQNNRLALGTTKRICIEHQLHASALSILSHSGLTAALGVDMTSITVP